MAFVGEFSTLFRIQVCPSLQVPPSTSMREEVQNWKGISRKSIKSDSYITTFSWLLACLTDISEEILHRCAIPSGPLLATPTPALSQRRNPEMHLPTRKASFRSFGSHPTFLNARSRFHKQHTNMMDFFSQRYPDTYSQQCSFTAPLAPAPRRLASSLAIGLSSISSSRGPKTRRRDHRSGRSLQLQLASSSTHAKKRKLQ